MTVITCAPNFPGGHVYAGYKNRLWQSEIMDGLRVIRVWSYITANEGFVKRVLDYVSYMTSAIVATSFIPKVDMIIGTSPQFFTACGAYLASLMKRVPFIFELRDIWPESIKAVGAMNDSAIIRMLEKIEMLLYREAACIVSVTESFKHTLVRRGIDGSKIKVVTNGVDLSNFKPQPKDKELEVRFCLEDKFVVGYVGTHGMAHALETILEAAAYIQKMNGGDAFKFILLGNGARKDHLRAMAMKMELKNVIFIDTVPKTEVARYWSLLDVSIIHLKKTELFTTVIPSKLFECMGMGIPVLHGVAGESAEIVKKEDVGLVFEPENSKDLCNGLIRLRENIHLYKHLKNNCLAAARHYDRAALAASMLNILVETTASVQRRDK